MTAAFKDKSIQNQTFNCFSSSQDGINRDCRYPNTPAIPYLWQLFGPLGSLALFRSSISKHEDHLSSYLTMFENMLANSGDPNRTKSSLTWVSTVLLRHFRPIIQGKHGTKILITDH